MVCASFTKHKLCSFKMIENIPGQCHVCAITIALPARESLQYSNKHSDKYYCESFEYNMLLNEFLISITICILYSIIDKIC